MTNREARQSYCEGNRRLINMLSRYNEVLFDVNETVENNSQMASMLLLEMEYALKELSINLNHLIKFAECPHDGQEMEINHLTNGRKII